MNESSGHQLVYPDLFPEIEVKTITYKGHFNKHIMWVTNDIQGASKISLGVLLKIY